MGTTNIRLVESLHEQARDYAAKIGISVNSLIALALLEYLEAKEGATFRGKPEPEQSIAPAQAVPAPANFRLEPSAPAVIEGVKSRQVRRQEARKGKK